MDQEFIPVDLGQHRVQVHKGPGTGNVKGQDPPDLCRLVAENILGQPLYGLGHGALGNAYGDGLGAEIQNVAALQGEGLVRGIIEGHLARKLRVVMEKIVAVDGLAAAGDGIHMVQRHAPADGGEGVAGKIEVGDGVQDEMGPVAAQRRQGASAPPGQLVKADTGHGLADQLPGRGQGEQHLCQLLPVAVCHTAAAVDEILHEPPPERVAALQRLGRQVRQVDDLDALLPQSAGKGVMLGLGAAKIGDVVKEKLLHGVGYQLLQLAAGAMQQHFFQRTDLTADVNSHKSFSLRFLF